MHRGHVRLSPGDEVPLFPGHRTGQRFACVSSMSNILIGMGQGGSQIAAAIMLSMAQHEGQYSSWNGSGRPACVLADSEPKAVLQAAAALSASPSMPAPAKEDLVFEQDGRANNWALGYTGGGSDGGNSLVCTVAERVRQLTERVDGNPSATLVHSWGGGTGSGGGCRLLEVLRDDVLGRHATLVSTAVCPFLSSGSPLQAYNVALSASSVAGLADACVLAYNDQLAVEAAASAAACAEPSPGKQAPPPSTSMHALNSAFAAKLRPLMQLQHTAQGPSQAYPTLLMCAKQPMPIWHIESDTQGGGSDGSRLPAWQSQLAHCTSRLRAAQRTFSALALPGSEQGGGAWETVRAYAHRSIPRPSHVWDSPVAQAWTASAAAHSTAEATQPYPPTATAATASAAEASSDRSAWLHCQGPATPKDEAWLAPLSSCRAPAWQQALQSVAAPHHEPHIALSASSAKKSPGAVKVWSSLALLVANGPVLQPLRAIAQHAHAKATVGAYLHLFEQYGCEQDTILEAAERTATL